jgi:hypothetical protein
MEEQFYTELYNILDENGISYEDNKSNRDTAIKIILELKKRKAIKFKKAVVNDEDIINTYLGFGIVGIKKMFSKNLCYLYSSEFVYEVLFYHYKQEWAEIQKLIISKINEIRREK